MINRIEHVCLCLIEFINLIAKKRIKCSASLAFIYFPQLNEYDPLFENFQSRFMSYSGGDCNAENSSYLPTTIISMNNGTAQYAQWNYR